MPRCAQKINSAGLLAATILGSSMVFIDGTVVNVALPALQTNLKANVVDVQWVIEAYALFLAALPSNGRFTWRPFWTQTDLCNWSRYLHARFDLVRPRS